jgi:AraC family transcriptional regulator
MSHDEKLALRIAGYIENNPGKPLCLSILSEKFYISKYTMERIFRAQFHLSVHQFILEKRLHQAYELIIETELPLKEIISIVGFKSITTFTKEFRERFNITPSALRKKT